MIRGMHHVGLSVSDLERSIAFYRDVLGLKVLRIIEAGAEMDLGRVVGLPGCSARIAHMGSDAVMFELFEYRDPRGRSISSDCTQADHGFIHAGFTSTDARTDYERMTRLGVKCLSEPVEFRTGVWIFYFYGPDGEVCEVRQA